MILGFNGGVDLKRINVKGPCEIKPNLSANTLFHFMSEARFLYKALEVKALFPRYCRENITYLNLQVNDHRLIEVAYPEKCFCDIPLHKVCGHTKKYGAFGIGFRKNWGIEKGLQPIQYVNSNSNLIKDFQKVFRKATEVTDENEIAQFLSNYLVAYMLYIKPLTGENQNRVTKDIENIYLTDEFEWRYVPDLEVNEMDSILFDNDICKKDRNQILLIDKYNDALEKLESTWLKFEYSDIKYITVDNYSDREELINAIKNFDGLDEKEELILISKIIVISEAEEDF